MNATAVVPNDQGCSLFTVAVCACSINTASASSTGYPITSLSLGLPQCVRDWGGESKVELIDRGALL